MSTGPNDGPEPTFADVMNAFSGGGGRKKRRRWGRRDEPESDPRAETPYVEYPEPPADVQADPFADGDEDEPHATEDGSTSVRPYAWTRGRTRTGYALEIETLVSTSSRGREQLVLLQVEHRAVADLCQRATSVAEVAALLKVPLGVAKVLVGDMAGLGLVVVHQSQSTNGDMPNLALMERVLSGLRRL